MTTVPISELPRILKARVHVPASAKDKEKLDAALVTLLEDFFSKDRLDVSDGAIRASLESIRRWRAEAVLGKLRSLLERQARKDIQEYCSKLAKRPRTRFSRALNDAGLYHFRKNIETDLYVGIHTAISANFKMLGVIHSEERFVPSGAKKEGLRQLLKALRAIAAQPLGVLMAFDGVFWDSKLYSVPSALHWKGTEAAGCMVIDETVLKSCLNRVVVEEIPTGCPAMRARTYLGSRAIAFVETKCMEVAKRFMAEGRRPGSTS